MHRGSQRTWWRQAIAGNLVQGGQQFTGVGYVKGRVVEHFAGFEVSAQPTTKVLISVKGGFYSHWEHVFGPLCWSWLNGLGPWRFQSLRAVDIAADHSSYTIASVAGEIAFSSWSLGT